MGGARCRGAVPGGRWGRPAHHGGGHTLTQVSLIAPRLLPIPEQRQQALVDHKRQRSLRQHPYGRGAEPSVQGQQALLLRNTVEHPQRASYCLNTLVCTRSMRQKK
eukprot:scaffold1439_cov404-Prasinococcus_capsulatus_cf.AAC.10